MSQGTFSGTLIRLEAFKRIFALSPKSTFFRGVGSGFLVKNEPILKFDHFCEV